MALGRDCLNDVSNIIKALEPTIVPLVSAALGRSEIASGVFKNHLSVEEKGKKGVYGGENEAASSGFDKTNLSSALRRQGRTVPTRVTE